MRATPVQITIRGPRASTTRPTNGLTAAEKRKPKEKAPAARPRSHLNSSINGGRSREKAVRPVTPIAIVTNAMATMSQP
jgi:hypothetical protein